MMNKAIAERKIYLVLLLFWSQGAVADAMGRIVETQNGQNISPEQLVQALSQAQIVLIGEQHDNAQHHAAQQWLLQQTEKVRQNGSVALEMLTQQQQDAVREVQHYLQQGGSTGKRSLAEKINWNAAWDWRKYQNIMYMLLHQKAQVLAASPDRDDLARQTTFVPQGIYSGDVSVRNSLSKLMYQHHADTQNLVSMQQYKDLTMSQVLLHAPKPAWLIAGNIHVSKQLGVPLFLRDAHFSGSLKTVLMTDEGSGADSQHADYIWFF